MLRYCTTHSIAFMFLWSHISEVPLHCHSYFHSCQSVPANLPENSLNFKEKIYLHIFSSARDRNGKCIHDQPMQHPRLQV